MKWGIKYLSFYLFFVFAVSNGFAQGHVMDSLKERLQRATEDTTRLNIYVRLADACEIKDNLTYCLPAIELADKLLMSVKDKKGRAIILKQKLYVQRNVVYYYQQTGKNIKAIEYVDNNLKLAEAKGDSDEIAAMLIACAALYEGNSFLVKALEYNLRALPIFQGLKDKTGLAYCLGNLARIYADQGDNAKALTYDLKALDMVQQQGNKIDIIRFMAKVSYAYDAVGDSAKSIELRLKALSIAYETGDKPSISTTLNYVGNFYIDHHSYAKAMEYILKALAVVQQIGDFDGLANDYGRMAKIYKSTHEYDKAMQYYFKALSVCEHMGDKGQTNYNWMRIGQMYTRKIVNYKLAKAYLDSAVYGFKTGGQVGFLDEAYGSKSILDSLTGDYKAQAVDMRYAFFYEDSLKNALATHQAVQMEMKYEFDQLQLKEKTEQAEKDAQAEADKRRQRTITWSVVGGLLLVLLFAGFVFRSLRITRKQNILIAQQKQLVEEKSKVVEEKNKDILDSITYAKRLQDAILPPISTIKKHLPESFVLYKPKDIVAGDFYWVASPPSEGGSKEHTSGIPPLEGQREALFIAAADCTGHGVPGAMVSVVCSNALNRTVKEFKITEPGKILDKVRELVLETFEKSEDNVQDGMDISLIAITPASLNPSKGGTEVRWAGAYNSLWYVQDGKMHEIAADKQPIGKADNPKSFTTHTIQLSPPLEGREAGTILYLFTDGYADQFGGPKGKKYKYKPLQEKLLAISHKPMEEQKQILETTLNEWKGDLEQVDDILMIGIRI